MNEALLIVLAEIIFILLMLLLTLLFVDWRRKRNHHRALQQLLNDVVEKEDQRKACLIDYLTDRRKLPHQIADDLSADFVEAEKQFISQFLEQQMKQAGVSDFYENLCLLLDKYLILMPAEKSPEERLRPNDAKHEQKTHGLNSVESDWDMAFAESGAGVNESVR
ncbi:hypothetical protein Q9L42_007115 [Methylomarinum sp. Ch1-1]|uniref:Uncharacterized protein n=1 Tax=Methylomarinum roseum TaxID=3067653 RepID=A0AAU7NY53_9GAMM|nr:hypothetical protein [Methylomarinum sp. Ch1-1]MDP4522013.1 hypothetical protein [Methylomarinum sp. Ch1-1]